MTIDTTGSKSDPQHPGPARAPHAAPLRAALHAWQALLGRSDHEGAVGELLSIIKKDRAWNEGAPKALLFQIFDSLGSDQ